MSRRTPVVVAAVIGVLAMTAQSLAVPSRPSTIQPRTLERMPRLTTTKPRPMPDVAVHVTRPVLLHGSPGGRVVARLRPRTEYRVPRVLPVVRQVGPWLGVIVTERPNGKLGWVHTSRVRQVGVATRVDIDLSERRLRVSRRGRTVLRMKVAVGAPDTPTPTGRFAVTDRLLGYGPYGCCILALSGRQSNLRAGWHGGDRVAVHGTLDASSVGRPVSSGCMRGHERAMRRLLKVVQLGARVRIRA